MAADDAVLKLANFFMENGFGGWDLAWSVMGFREFKRLGFM